MLAICLTAASPWPRKATQGCVHVFAWYRTKSDRHVLGCMLLKPKKNRTDFSTDYQVPTKKMKYFNEKSKVTILTYISCDIICEYENFGSARTPVIKSSTSKYKRPHRIFVLLHTTYDEYVRIIRVPVRLKNANETRTIRRKPNKLLCILLEKLYTTARILQNE